MLLEKEILDFTTWLYDNNWKLSSGGNYINIQTDEVKSVVELMNQSNLTTEEIITEIIKLECEVTASIFKGHKSNDEDEYSNHRKRLSFLRKILKSKNVIVSL
jgi:hypothetical protein